MSDFEKALRFVLEHECVYKKRHWGKISDEYVISENEDNDPGGLTKWGIDQRSHPHLDIENLSLQDATDIYKKEYWDKYRCGELEWPLNAVYFDGCVNMGAGQITKLLQRVVGAADDGALGPNTRAAVNAACKVRSTEVVAMQLIDKKKEFYKDLVKEKPKYAKFLDGWLNRSNDLKEAIV